MDSLTQLKDIKLPPAVSIWPLAYGWYVLMAVLLCLGLVFLFCYAQYRKKTLVKRLILQKLTDLKQAHLVSEHKNIFEELSKLLKQAALYVYPRNQVAGLQGDAWLQFLDNTLGENNKSFSQGPGKILISAPYQAQAEQQTHDLVSLIEVWVKKNL